MMYDVIIVGAGVTGSAIARQLSRYDVNACVLEKMRMSVRAPRRQIRRSFMPASMLPRAR